MPTIEPVEGPFGRALTVDVEEWYHNCWMDEYLDPATRPPLVEELDWLLPELLDWLQDCGAKATFFILGELTARAEPGLTPRLREIAEAGHEIASHGFVHYRVGDLTVDQYVEDLRCSKTGLEQATGVEVLGYRAPEWSLRSVRNERLALVAEAGYRYDSSLAPCWGTGRTENPRRVSRLGFEHGLELIEVPPTALLRRLRMPASGWLGRLTAPRAPLAAVRRHQAGGGLPVLNVHPWELIDRPLPGRLRGFGRWAHEVGRRGFRGKLERILRQPGERWYSIRGALARSRDTALASVVTTSPDEHPRRHQEIRA